MANNMLSKTAAARQKQQRRQRGSVAVTSILFLTLIIGGSLGAIDLARHNIAQQRLTNALDAAVISAGRNLANYTPIDGEITDDQWVDDARDYFRRNMPAGYLGSTIKDDHIRIIYTEERGGEGERYLMAQKVSMQATGTLPLISTGYLDVSSMNLGASNEAIRRNRSDLEVVLVLDNTGSMSRQQRLTTLKSASKNLIDAVLGGAELGGSRAYVGLVPFSHVVNVGNNRFTREWLSADWRNQRFITNANAWYGCIAEPRPNDQTETHIRTAGMETGNFTPLVSTINERVNVLASLNITNGSIVQSPPESAPSVRQGIHVWQDPAVAQNQLSVNYLLNPDYCVRNRTVQFLSDEQADLEQAITTMTANGATAIPTGILWGWRMLDSSWAGEWSDETVELADGSFSSMPREPHRDLSKVMILLTDGENDVADINITPNGIRETFRFDFTYTGTRSELVRTNHNSNRSCRNAGYTWSNGACYRTVTTGVRESATHTLSDHTVCTYNRTTGPCASTNLRATTSLHAGSSDITPDIENGSETWSTGRISDLNNLTEALCQNVRDDDILIYTVVLGNDITEGVKNMMTRCAGSSDRYYDSTAVSDLPKVFTSIAGALMELRLTK